MFFSPLHVLESDLLGDRPTPDAISVVCVRGLGKASLTVEKDCIIFFQARLSAVTASRLRWAEGDIRERCLAHLEREDSTDKMRRGIRAWLISGRLGFLIYLLIYFSPFSYFFSDKRYGMVWNYSIRSQNKTVAIPLSF